MKIVEKNMILGVQQETIWVEEWEVEIIKTLGVFNLM